MASQSVCQLWSHLGCGYAGRRHEKDIHGDGATLTEHEGDALKPHHVCNFMGVGDNGGCAVDHQCPGEHGGRKHAALDVDVAVDQSGNDPLPVHMEFLLAAITMSDTHNDAFV